MKKYAHLLLLWCLLPFTSLQAQTDTAYIYTFGGQNMDQCRSVIYTLDKGLLLTGTTASFGKGTSDIYLVKLDSMRQLAWSKTIGSPNVERGFSALQLADSNYLIAGFTNSSPAGDYDAYLVKINNQGDTLWTRRYGGADWDFAYSLCALADGGFAFTGETFSDGNSTPDLFLTRIDSSGETLWTKTWGGNGVDIGHQIIAPSDTSIAIIGQTGSFGNGSDDVWLLCLNLNGDTLWTKTYGDTASNIGYGLTYTSDHRFVLTGGGYPVQNGFGQKDAFMTTTDSLGNIIWSGNIGSGGNDEGRAVTELDNGNYVLSGISNSDGSGGYGMYYIYMHHDSWFLTGATFGGNLQEEGYSISYRDHLHLAMAGSTTSFGQGLEDMYLVELDTLLANFQIQNSFVNDPLSIGPLYNYIEGNGSLYPNPFREEARLHFNRTNGSTHAILSIFNTLGECVRQEEMIGSELVLQRKNLVPGLYFFSIRDNQQILYQGRFLIQP